ncbi:hypothetical protein Tco_0998765 [Tanacetum coccineum]
MTLKTLKKCDDWTSTSRRGTRSRSIIRMFLKESDVVEKYVGGLPNMIQGSVMATKLKTMQDAIEIANDLMDKKIRIIAERQAENKRKLDNNNLLRSKMWQGLILLGLVRRRSILGLIKAILYT